MCNIDILSLDYYFSGIIRVHRVSNVIDMQVLNSFEIRSAD